MPHAPPPNNFTLDDQSFVILVGYCGAVTVAVILLVASYYGFPLSYALSLIGATTDTYILAFGVLALCGIGLVSELHQTFFQKRDAIRLKLFVVTAIIAAIPFWVYAFSIEPFVLMGKREGQEAFEIATTSSMILRGLWGIGGGLIAACLIFTLSFFEYWWLRLRGYDNVDSLIKQGRFETLFKANAHRFQEQSAAAPEAESTTQPFDIEIDWSMFDDNPEAYRSAADSRLRKARETDDPEAAAKYTAEAQLLLAKMDELHRLPKPEKRLMIEDKRDEDK